MNRPRYEGAGGVTEGGEPRSSSRRPMGVRGSARAGTLLAAAGKARLARHTARARRGCEVFHICCAVSGASVGVWILDVMDTLDRDCRTVRVRVSDMCCAANSPCRLCCSPTPTQQPHTVTVAAATTQRAHHRRSFTHRLGEVLTLSACLLFLVRWPSAMAAPTPRRRPIPPGKPKMWVNPCGVGQPQDHDGTDYHQLEVLTDKQMLQNVILEAHNALLSVEGFKHQYVMETFQQEFMKHHNEWKDHSYDWLPKFHVPKSLGITIDPSHMQNIQLDDFLRDAYRYLQIMAVALEQVEWDQGDGGNPAYQESFRKVMQRLRLVLCEILTAMIERKVDPHPDVDRNIMRDEFRDIDSDTKRNLRDWIIFRDYMIVLEYLMEVSKHFVDNPNRIPPSS